MKFLSSVILCLTCFSVLAYASTDWNGRVVDVSGAPVPYANVILLSSADSSILCAATTDEEGNYMLASTRKDAVMKVAILGYRTVLASPSDNSVIRLETDSEMLGGAVLSEVMPKTKLTGEGLQTSVKGSVLEDIGTAHDVLARTPGLMKTKDGLQVIGRGTPLVYINGHKVNDLTELDRLLSSEIQSIEVITNPGAQYDATVTSVVRIRTVRHQGEGFSFNVGSSDAQSLVKRPEGSLQTFPNNDPGAYFKANYRVKGVDLFAGITFDQTSLIQDSHIYQKTIGGVSYLQDGTVFFEEKDRDITVDGGVNWQISSNHSVGFKIDYVRPTFNSGYEVLKEKLFRDEILIDDLTSTGQYGFGDRKPYRFNSNAYYNGQIGKLNIDFNFDCIGRVSTTNSVTEEKSAMTEDSRITTFTSGDSRLSAAKLVLLYPVWVGMAQLGTEETFTRRYDEYVIKGVELPSSNTCVKENNYAVFANYSFVFLKKWQGSAGLRYEHIDYSYTSTDGKSDLSRRYDNFFPSFSLSGAAGPVQLMLNYSVKTQRPSFSQLSDAIQYNSRYVLQTGNSKLQPYQIRTTGLSAIWKWVVFG